MKINISNSKKKKIFLWTGIICIAIVIIGGLIVIFAK
jgi:hypothetical protein